MYLLLTTKSLSIAFPSLASSVLEMTLTLLGEVLEITSIFIYLYIKYSLFSLSRHQKQKCKPLNTESPESGK